MNINNYENVLKLKVFTLQDLINTSNNINSANKLISKLLKQGYIKKIKHNLYAVCDIETKKVLASQYVIASKIKDDAYISYHTALEYYGVKNQTFYSVFVSSSKRFQNFAFDGYTYTYINSKNDFGIIQQNNIKVTDKERTFLDCINKTDLAGGNEELLLCLEIFGKLDDYKLLEYLKKYNSKKLYAKAGFMLELLNAGFGVNKNTIITCHQKSNNQKYYFNSETKDSERLYISDWNLIVPKIFLNRGETLNW